MSKILRIPIDRIKPDPNQPRKYFSVDALKRLSGSLQKRGQRQPGIVRAVSAPDHDYVIVDGERRWRAAKLAGIEFYKAILSEQKTEADWFEESVISNFGREGHTHREIVNAIVRLRNECGYTVEQIAEAMAKSDQWVYSYLLILKLHPTVQLMMDETLPLDQRIGFSTAVYVLAKIEDHKIQIAAAQHIVAKGLNQREARVYVAKLGNAHGFRTRKSNKPSDDLPVLESFVKRLTSDAEYVLALRQHDFAAILQTQSIDRVRRLRGDLDTATESLATIRQALDRVIDARAEKARTYGGLATSAEPPVNF